MHGRVPYAVGLQCMSVNSCSTQPVLHSMATGRWRQQQQKTPLQDQTRQPHGSMAKWARRRRTRYRTGPNSPTFQRPSVQLLLLLISYRGLVTSNHLQLVVVD